MNKSLINKNSGEGITYVALVFVLIIGVVIALSAVFYQKNQKEETSIVKSDIPSKITKDSSSNKMNNEFDMVCDSLDIKFDNPQDIFSSEKVKLICIIGNSRKVALEINDMCTNHYHSYELVDGNIYLIRRIGYDGYPDDDWIDELWVYYKDGKSKKIAISKGLDFRVSSTGNNVVVDKHNNGFLIINNTDNSQNELDVTKYLANSNNEPDIVGITDDYVWLEERSTGPYVSAFHKIELKNNSIKSYPLPKDISGFNQYSLNLDLGLIAYTNYPALFEEYAAKEFEESDAQITLNVYDLKVKDTTFVAKGTKTKFAPKWIDTATLEYKNPNGEGTLQKTF